MSDPAIAPVAIAPGEGLSVENPTAGVVTFMLTADTTGGALTAIESVSAPGEGPPLHVHREQDELIYILEGTYRVKLGDEVTDAPAGTCVFIPRGTPHTWQSVGEAPGRFLATVMPAARGFEQFFVRYAELPAPERGAAAFARLGSETEALEVLGPPLAQSDPLGSA